MHTTNPRERIREMKLNWSITHSPTLRDSQQHTYITRTYNNRNIPKMKLNSDHMKHRKTQISTPYIVVGRTAMSYVDIYTPVPIHRLDAGTLLPITQSAKLSECGNNH